MFHVPSTFCTSQLRNNTNLHIASFSSTFHPACNIYRVAPNVVVRLFGANYSGYNRTLTDSLKKEKGKLLIGNTEGFGNGLSLSLRLFK